MAGKTLSARPKKTEPEAGQANAPSLQDRFLNLMRKEKAPVTVFLVKGVKLQGIVTWFDNFSLLLRRDGQSQLVYKHAISTIMPAQPQEPDQFGARNTAKKQRLLQEVFLGRCLESEAQVTMFLINGVMLQGRIAAYDPYCTLLEREGYVQLAYKHAISTIQPVEHLDLSEQGDND
jgi:host factor-I protein